MLAVEGRLAATQRKSVAGAGRFARQHDVIAPSALREPRANIGFGATLRFRARRYRIHLGGIDEIDSLGERVIELLVSLFFGVLLAPGHGSQTDLTDLDVGLPQPAVLHLAPPRLLCDAAATRCCNECDRATTRLSILGDGGGCRKRGVLSRVSFT